MTNIWHVCLNKKEQLKYFRLLQYAKLFLFFNTLNSSSAYDGTEPAITPWQMWKNGDVKANTLIALVTTINPGKFVSDILNEVLKIDLL